MKCSGCRTENPEQAKFCIECGATLEFHCPKCRAVTPGNGKFCMECGHNLRKEEPATPVKYDQPQSYTPKHLADKILTNRSAIEGERKLVTVLFADVANFTAMNEKLDPEEVHHIMDGCFKILMDEIHRCEGTINQFTGDGVMALFGAPVAHEDHAQRACRAALAVQKALEVYGERIKQQHGVPFQMRIGLNSGPVIVGAIGDDLRMDYTAVGDTTNLAARVEQQTEPGQIFLSRETQNIIKDYFESEPVGEMTFKGKSKPQTIYRLISGFHHVRNRFEAGLVRGVTELVGRKREIAELTTAFKKLKSGEAQIVDVVGEAGIGKSRLVYEFRKSLEDQALFLTGLCLQYGGNINFLPVMDIVKAAFGIERDMNEAEAGQRIEEKAIGPLAAMIPFYRSLLSLKVDAPDFGALQPEGRKFGTFEAVKDLLIRLGEEKPLVVFVEDVHWIDKISEEFFTFFSRCVSDHPIMLLSAYRPEGAPPWAKGMHYQRLGLETLSSRSSIHLVHNILGGLALEPALENRIVEKTKGNPFFVEEIVRELLERGEIIKSNDRYVSSRPIDQLHIPNTVQAVLAARMDRLSDDLKSTMQVASVIGRDFAFKILKTILELGDELRGHLTNLVGLEILYEKALFPELEYIFKHALTQEVAYESILKQRRQAIHERIAKAVEELYGDRLDQHYELLAHHYERSGNVKKALYYLILAGEKSNGQNAIRNAWILLNKAHNFICQKEIAIDKELECRLYYGLSSANLALGHFNETSRMAKKAIRLSNNHGMLEIERKSYFIRNILSWSWPDRTEAIRNLDAAIQRARELGDKVFESQSLSWKGITESIHGSVKKGLETVRRARRLAAESKDAFSISITGFHSSFAERWLGRPGRVIQLTDHMIEAMVRGFTMATTSSIIFWRGIALAEVGRIEDAISTLDRGVDISLKFGPFWRHPNLLNSLGYCYSEIYQTERALSLNAESEKMSLEMLAKDPTGRLLYSEAKIMARINTAENHFDKGKLDACWNLLLSVEEDSKSSDYDLSREIWHSRIKYMMAQTLLRKNDTDNAEGLIYESLERVKDLGLKKREGCFLRLMGEIQTRKNDLDAAINYHHKAIRLLKEVGNPRKIWEAHAALASVYAEVGRHADARENWRAAAEVVEKQAMGLSDKNLKESFLLAAPIHAILQKSEK